MAFEIVEFEKLIESHILREVSKACRRISNSGQGTKLSKYHFRKLSNLSLQLYGIMLKPVM
jgi:CRISPR/Cas system-associated endonuclease Cas3-HD